MKRELLDNGNIWQKSDGRWIGLVFSWILTNACGIVVVTKKGGCFNETRIIR